MRRGGTEQCNFQYLEVVVNLDLSFKKVQPVSGEERENYQKWTQGLKKLLVICLEQAEYVNFLVQLYILGDLNAGHVLLRKV